MVKELTDIEEIWKRLIESYGDHGVLLQNKLGALAKMGGLNKTRGREGLIIGISELLNAMAELKKLAETFNLENRLYEPLRGLGKVCELMGSVRYERFLKKYRDHSLSDQEEWDKIALFLEDELKTLKMYVAKEKSMQPLCMGITKPEIPNKGDKKSDKSLGSRDGYIAAGGNDDLVCVICGKKGHKTYVSSFSDRKK